MQDMVEMDRDRLREETVRLRLQLRDTFAMSALTGILSNTENFNNLSTNCALAFEYADEMLLQREKS
jgi:hypothetical protein